MTVGEVLKKRRTEKRLLIEDVSHRLKISAKKIQALEANTWDRVPVWVYTRGYIAKYARYLGLDEKTLVAQCEAEYGTVRSMPVTLPRLQSAGFAITPSSGIFVAIGVFFGGIGLYLIFNWINFFAPPKLVLETPHDNSITEQGEIMIMGSAETGAKLTINGAPIYPGEDGRFEVQRFLQAGLNVIEVRAMNNVGKDSVEVRRVLYRQEL